MLGEDVDLEVDPVAGLAQAEGGAGEGLGDQADRERLGAGLDDRQAHAVDGDGALVDEVLAEAGGHRDLDDLPVLAGLAAYDVADGVDVALDDVAAQALVGGHGALEVDPVAGLDALQAGLVEGLLHDVGGPAARRRAWRRSGSSR